MKDQTAERRGQASRYDAWVIVASGLLVGCGVTGQGKSRGDAGSCETCSADGGSASGPSAAGTCGVTCGEPEQTSTVTATSVDTRNDTSVDASNNTSVATSNGLDAGSSPGSEVAPLDGGQTCSDNTACSRSDGSDSEIITNGSTLSDADASTSNTTSEGVATDAMPSRGCTLGNATPALELSYFSRDTTITLPEGYDGSTPLPIVLALHASGMFNEMEDNFPADHPLRKNFIVVTPHSMQSSGGFENERFTEFTDLRLDLGDSLCFDTERFFAIGHASGARVASRLSFEDYQFRAIALIGAAAGTTNSIPTLFVHATEDSYSIVFDDLDGSTSAARFASNNGCTTDTVPFAVAEALDTTGTDAADCVDYQGCAQSVRWCRFEYVQTSAAFEYWPSFASDLIYEFFVAPNANLGT